MFGKSMARRPDRGRMGGDTLVQRCMTRRFEGERDWAAHFRQIDRLGPAFGNVRHGDMIDPAGACDIVPVDYRTRLGREPTSDGFQNALRAVKVFTPEIDFIEIESGGLPVFVQ